MIVSTDEAREDSVGRLESVRIGKCQNWKVSELESVRIGKCSTSCFDLEQTIDDMRVLDQETLDDNLYFSSECMYFTFS